jgi:hypothetical protein
MQIHLFRVAECRWRADPVQLTGLPPNGVGPTAEKALIDLLTELTSAPKKGPGSEYWTQMIMHGWLCIETVMRSEDEGYENRAQRLLGWAHGRQHAVNTIIELLKQVDKLVRDKDRIVSEFENYLKHLE